MFRLIIIALAIYVGYKLIVRILKPASIDQPRVGGEANDSQPIDLSDKDVEDAKYRDIDE